MLPVLKHFLTLLFVNKHQTDHIFSSFPELTDISTGGSSPLLVIKGWQIACCMVIRSSGKMVYTQSIHSCPTTSFFTKSIKSLSTSVVSYSITHSLHSYFFLKGCFRCTNSTNCANASIPRNIIRSPTTRLFLLRCFLSDRWRP